MRILIWSPPGAGKHYWGPGMSAYRLYQHASKDNISVSLAHGYRDQERYDLFENQYFISDFRGKGFLSNVLFLRKAKKWIKENAYKFDVAHCLADYHNTFMPALWFEQNGVKAIIKVVEAKAGFVRSSFFSELLGLRQYRIKNANKISAYITMSKEMDEDLLSVGIQKSKVHNIQDGVNIKRFKPASTKTKKALRKELGLPDKFTVIFTGGFSARKNPSIVVEAFGKLKGRDNDLQLVLIGPDRDDGTERKKSEEIVKREKLSNVIILDFVEEIEKYYRASNVFILPSSNEGLSNSMLEAQSCGLPSIVTKISGAEDIIDEQQNGTFIKQTPDSVAYAVESYLLNEEKLEKHSEGARERILRNNSSEVVFKKHIELFRGQN